MALIAAVLVLSALTLLVASEGATD